MTKLSTKMRMLLMICITPGVSGLILCAAMAARSQAPASSAESQRKLYPMSADADPTFDVATIKRSEAGTAKVQVHINGHTFVATNASLTDLITFAYNVEADQVVGLPKAIQDYRCDIVAVPDHEGVPSMLQLQGMVRKLLANRFNLAVHHDKRTLPAYELSIMQKTKGLSPSRAENALPHISTRPASGAVTITFRNATLKEMASYLQLIVLDRPVIDTTGIPDRFDFNLTFTPDESQFHGHSPLGNPPPNVESESPGLFQAIKEQLGLALRPDRVPVDVISVDHAETNSPN